MSTGGIGGIGGSGASGGSGAAGGKVTPAAGAQGPTSDAPSGAGAAKNDKVSSSESELQNTGASGILSGRSGMHSMGMSTQDFATLSSQCVQPASKPEMDIRKMLELLLAMKMLEAMK